MCARRKRCFFPSIVLLLLSLVFITALAVLYDASRIYGEDSTNSTLTITHGIASGDVTENSAIVWSRVNLPSIMHVEFSDDPLFSVSNSNIKWVDYATDFTGAIKLENLTGATKYFYRVWFSSTDNRINSTALIGTFKTAPKPTTDSNKSISFIVAIIVYLRHNPTCVLN